MVNKPVEIYLKRLSPGSRVTAICSLKVMTRFLSDNACVDPLAFHWHKLNSKDISAVYLFLSKKYKFSTASSYFSILNQVLKICNISRVER